MIGGLDENARLASSSIRVHSCCRDSVSFYSTTYYPDRYLPPPFPFQNIIIRPSVVYPEREFGVALIATGSILVVLILTIQTVLSRFNRHRNQARQRNLSPNHFHSLLARSCFSICQHSEVGEGSRAGWQKEKGKMIRRIGETFSVPAPEPLLPHTYKVRFNGIRLLSFECIDLT